MKEKLELLNRYPFKKREGNRREAYLQAEKEFMQPLPANQYESPVWSGQTLLLDYTVANRLNKYSVPYDLIDEVVSVCMTHDEVKGYFKGNRVALHPRDRERRRNAIVQPSHMPGNHKQYLFYAKEDFETWASSIGPNTEMVVHFGKGSGTGIQVLCHP